MNDIPHAAAPPAAFGAAPRRVLSVFDGAMIVVGIVIGAGIFKTPSMVAGSTGGPRLTGCSIDVVVGRGLSLIGALCYADWQPTFPNAAATITS